MELERVYQNIKRMRESRMISRNELASRLGMTLSGYGKIERGEVDISLSRLSTIAEILQVELSELLDINVKQVFNFNLQHNSTVQAPGAKADTLNFYGDQLQEKYVEMLEKEIDRLSKKIKEE